MYIPIYYSLINTLLIIHKIPSYTAPTRMKKEKNKPRFCAYILTSLILLSATAFSQDASVSGTQNLVRNLMCLLLWVMPFIILLFFIGGSFLILTGGAPSRNAGKKMIRNAIASLIILLSLMLFVSLALPGVDVRVCFGYLPGVANQPPIAEARVSYKPSPSEKSAEITAGDTAYFDASLSKDTDGVIVEYIWDYGDGTFGDGFFSDHVYNTAGEYYVLLRVRDDKGAMSLIPSLVRVIVNPPLEVSSEVRRPVYETVVGA
jgi:hypothetical protein